MMRKAADESATGLALLAERKRLHKVNSSVRKMTRIRKEIMKGNFSKQMTRVST